MNKIIAMTLTLLSFLISIALTSTPVTASYTAITQNSPVATTSAKWSIAPQTTSTGTATTSLNLGTVPKTTGSLFFLVNLGTMDSLSQTITPTTPTGTRTIVIAYCLVSPGVYGVWTGATTYTCSTGTLTNICTVTSTVTTCLAIVPLAVGGNVHLRIVPSANMATIINVSLLNGTDTRAAVTTNS